MTEHRANVILVLTVLTAAVAAFLGTSWAFGEMATTVYNARMYTTSQGMMGWGHYIPVVMTAITIFFAPTLPILDYLAGKTQKSTAI